ncbi:hypothetical protein WOC76_01125 [Methylocystis sp. IM3]|uniref:hypothetical protein n=1 Tax=unclassified Methylocystis TaxID=2625913 RepID=UPI0030FB47EF
MSAGADDRHRIVEKRLKIIDSSKPEPDCRLRQLNVRNIRLAQRPFFSRENGNL